jgi:hypothetical protein
MLKELIARIRGKKQQPCAEPVEVPRPPAVPVGLFWYDVVQPGEARHLIYVLDRQQREISRYQVWVN